MSKRDIILIEIAVQLKIRSKNRLFRFQGDKELIFGDVPTNETEVLYVPPIRLIKFGRKVNKESLLPS